MELHHRAGRRRPRRSGGEHHRDEPREEEDPCQDPPCALHTLHHATVRSVEEGAPDAHSDTPKWTAGPPGRTSRRPADNGGRRPKLRPTEPAYIGRKLSDRSVPRTPRRSGGTTAGGAAP